MYCKAIVACVLAFVCVAQGTQRTLLQAPPSSANPPNSRFGGPTPELTSSVAAPAGTSPKFNWRGVGTQNYTATGAQSQYAANGAVADMYLQNGTKVGQHFFVKNADGSISPAFTRETASGQLLGRVVGTPIANQTAPATNDDGGYGSIPLILLRVTSADGFFAGVTFIQRINTLGGVVPGNPKLTGLPNAPFGTPNFNLAVPYQADYLFLAPGTTPGSAPPATG